MSGDGRRARLPISLYSAFVRSHRGAKHFADFADFDHYEIVPQDEYVSAIALGPDETYLATDRGVWKRPPWQATFEPVARIPSPSADGTYYAANRMAFRPDGRGVALSRLVTRRSDEGKEINEMAVEVWDAAGYTSQAAAFHNAEITRVGFEPGGRLIASSNGDAPHYGNLSKKAAPPLRAYRTAAGDEVQSPQPEPGDRRVFHAGPDAAQIVTLSGRTVRVWDVWAKDGARRERAAAFGGALDDLETMALSPGGRFLALGGPGGGESMIVVYRSDGGEYAEVRRFGLGDANLKRSSLGGADLNWSGGMALSADGRRLAVIYREGKDYEKAAHLFDDGVENAALRESLDGLNDVESIALSADGRYLAAADRNPRTNDLRVTTLTRLLDTREGVWETLLDNEHVKSIAFSPDGALVWLGSDEGVLHVFETKRSGGEGVAGGDARGPKEEIARLQHFGEVTAVAFSDDGKYVATASGLYRSDDEGFAVRVWLLRPADLIAESEQHLGQLKAGGVESSLPPEVARGLVSPCAPASRRPGRGLSRTLRRPRGWSRRRVRRRVA